MWYWLIKLEGIVLALPFIVYYALRGIPFSLRCKRCRRWLLEQRSLRPGMCIKCQREMIFSQHPEYWDKEYASPECREPSGFIHRRVAKRARNGRILDVGCGGGYILSKVQSQHRELFGFDITLEGVKRAKKWVKEVNFCLGDARNIPFKPDTFDCLTCSEVLEHIPSDEPFRELYRVLKPGGIALVTVPNGRGPSGKESTHIRFFSSRSIVNLLKEAGFEVISCQKFGLYLPFITPILSVLYQILGKGPPPLYPLDIDVPEFLSIDFLIECRKPPI